MTKNTLFTALEKLLGVSCKMKRRLVLIGGIATSLLAKPRATYDIDGIISLAEEEIGDFLILIKKSGFKFDIKKPVKFIEGLPFITFYYPSYKTYIDLFIAKNEFQRQLIRRAKRVRLKRLSLYIISPEDLILIKLQTARHKDIEDAREIILQNKSKLDYLYLEKQANLLGVKVFLKDELRSLGLQGRIR